MDLDRSDGNVESGEVGERARVTAFRTFSRTWHLSLRANSLSDSRIEIFRSAFFVPATCDDRLITSLIAMSSSLEIIDCSPSFLMEAPPQTCQLHK